MPRNYPDVGLDIVIDLENLQHQFIKPPFAHTSAAPAIQAPKDEKQRSVLTLPTDTKCIDNDRLKSRFRPYARVQAWCS